MKKGGGGPCAGQRYYTTKYANVKMEAYYGLGSGT
jgi:hypothetical protein